MNDGFGRKIDYLRLSVTERCQQKCSYCSKSIGGKCIKDSELRTKDFIFIAKACSTIGFKKIRLTGGEPLLRRDLAKIIFGISGLGAYEDIAITTNGMMLAQQAEELKSAGLVRCNISLDSLKSETYRLITGGELSSALAGIEAAVKCGLFPVKINCVLIKGVNSGEVDSFIDLARDYPIDVRFIELMPMGDGGEGVSNSEIIADRPFLSLCEEECGSEPAVYYRGKDFRGRVGFISPISQSFCRRCNRIRITCDGTVRPCLGSNLEFSLREAIFSENEELLKSAVIEAINQKPKENSFGYGFEPSRKMNRIGG